MVSMKWLQTSHVTIDVTVELRPTVPEHWSGTSSDNVHEKFTTFVSYKLSASMRMTSEWLPQLLGQ